jgi:quinol monooxygenase YgiN
VSEAPQSFPYPEDLFKRFCTLTNTKNGNPRYELIQSTKSPDEMYGAGERYLF